MDLTSRLWVGAHFRSSALDEGIGRSGYAKVEIDYQRFGPAGPYRSRGLLQFIHAPGRERNGRNVTLASWPGW